MQDLPAGRRLPGRLHDLGRVVLLPDERPGRVPVPLLRVQLPGRIVRQPVLPVLHEHGRALHASAALWRPAVRVPAGRGPDSEPRVVDGPDVSSRSQARRQVVQTAVLQVPRRRLARRRLFLTRTKVSLGAIQGCVGCGGGPCNPCVGVGPICTDAGFPCKTCQQGAGCPESCQTSGEWFCCLTSGRVGCRFRCSECNCPPGCANLSCHCFTNMAVPCTPRLHSGDQPCVCPPAGAPIPSLS
jgi:hypothetical protein